MKASSQLLIVVLGLASASLVLGENQPSKRFLLLPDWCTWMGCPGVTKRPASTVNPRIKINEQNYVNAVDVFQNVTQAVEFQVALDNLSPLMNYTNPQYDCGVVCKENAKAVLGPAYRVACAACQPLCDGAIAKASLAYLKE